eukprot:9080273-Lingulodinium_polyedra.AAC.1
MVARLELAPGRRPHRQFGQTCTGHRYLLSDLPRHCPPNAALRELPSPLAACKLVHVEPTASRAKC